ncbi:MAG: sigma-70 family RNA polymerase sigma factor [Blastocatellia bacterium]
MEYITVMTQTNEFREEERDPVVLACQQGDQDAFRHLVEKHQQRVYSLALHFTGNEATARDIAQQVFLKLLTRIHQFQWQSTFQTWLYRLVANTCYDEQRRWRRWLPFQDAAEDTHWPASENLEVNLHRQEVALAVQVAIRSLSPKLRMPILLKYIEGMSYEEIGQVLGCSMGTVASRLNRGHKVLADKLGYLREKLEREDV